MPTIATASTICGSSTTPAASRSPAMPARRRWTACKHRFAYAFDGKSGYPAVAAANLLPDHMNLNGISVQVVDQPHGDITTAGLRFDAGGHSIVYSTDFNEMTPEMENRFQGVDLWIVDSLRRRPHPTHPHLDLALDWIARLQPKRAVLTHMDNSMDYDTLRGRAARGGRARL